MIRGFLVTLIICLAVIIIPAVASSKFEYGIMIDAGSSGTRCFVYQWPKRTSPRAQQGSPFSSPVTQADWSKKWKIPISSFNKAPDTINTLFDPIVEFATKILQDQGIGLSERNNVPFYLGATAGMRRLPTQERINIMKSIRLYLDKSPFLFSSSYARILSGNEEALYGWIASNYLLNTLVPSIDSNPSSIVTYGALDLGGASAQISLVPREHIADHHVDWVAPTLYTHELYAISFLGFGITEFIDRFKDYITHTVTVNDAPIANPCYVNSTPPSHWKNTITGITSILVPPEVPSHDQCIQAIKPLLYLDATHCFSEQCTINGQYSPSIPSDMTFYAMSAFVSVMSPWKIDGKTAWSTSQIAQRATEVCKFDYKDITDTYHVPIEYADAQCLDITYVALLLAAYKLPENKETIIFQDTINNVELSWALGNMVLQVNLLDYQRDKSQYIFIILFVYIAIWILYLIIGYTSTQCVKCGYCQSYHDWVQPRLTKLKAKQAKSMGNDTLDHSYSFLIQEEA